MTIRPQMVRVFGTGANTLTQSVRQHLGMLNIPFEFIDIDANEDARAWVRDVNNGVERVPTLDIDGIIVTQPDDENLVAALMQRQLVKAD